MIRYLLVFLLLAFPAHALTLKGDIAQGSLVRGQVEPGTQVFLNGQELLVSPAGEFLFGIGREMEGALTLKTRGPQPVTKKLTVAKRDWDIQRIDGLPPGKVTPSEEDQRRIAQENRLIVQARNRRSAELYLDEFIWPAKGRISGVFGSQRILNGEPKSPHKGLDIAAPVGTEIIAAADGVVSLVHDDMFYTGKTVMIDHGLGLSTIYIHMNSIAVQRGESVKKGQRIGSIGTTGRSSGPHLHFGVNWFDVAVDPYPLLPAKN